jgi:methylated-DNA-[protein]-cysteine S-methyltransferase
LVARLSPEELPAYAGELRGSHPVKSVVGEYFDGNLRGIEALAVAQPGGPFRQAAWRAMRNVKPGRVVSYADLAETAGNLRAVRAAGTACAANRIALLVPCHRIVRTGGALGNYFYGVDVKQWLLKHEGFVGA